MKLTYNILYTKQKQSTKFITVITNVAVVFIQI